MWTHLCEGRLNDGATEKNEERGGGVLAVIGWR